MIAPLPPVAAEFAVGTKADELGLQGIKGNMGIRTDPQPCCGVGLNHIVQVDTGDIGGDFVAIGTYNGFGSASSPLYDCVNDWTLKWSIYVDAELGGIYRCATVNRDKYGAGANPSFKIIYEWCAGPNTNSWALYMGTTLYRCWASQVSTGERIIAGLETQFTSQDENIDVKYTNMNRRKSGTWYNFGLPNFFPCHPNYKCDYVSTTAFNTYLPPLD